MDITMSTSSDQGSKACTPLSAFEPKQIEWIWRKRIPKGVITLLEGNGGVGKSTIVAAVCAALSKGEKLPDDDSIREPIKILLLANEDDPNCVLRPRFEANGADLERVILLTQALLLATEGAKNLRKYILEHQIGLVVIDPIVAYMATSADMNKATDVRSTLNHLVEIGKELGTTFLVLRHFNKSREGSASSKGAGSVDFRNCARSTLQVVSSDGQSYLALEKTNYAARAKTLPFSINEGRVVWGEACDLTADDLHSDAENQGGRRKMDEAIEFLQDELKDGARQVREVTNNARDLGISEITLRRAREELKVETKKINGKWTWRLDEVVRPISLYDHDQDQLQNSNKTSYQYEL